MNPEKTEVIVSCSLLLDVSLRSRDKVEIYILRFNSSQLHDEQFQVFRADLRLYHSERNKRTCRRYLIQVCDDFDQGKSQMRKAFHAKCYSVQSEKIIDGNFVGWIIFDATRIVQNWPSVSALSSEIKVVLTCNDKGAQEEKMTKNRGAPEKLTYGASLLGDSLRKPSVLVWMQRQNSASRKRQRRSLNLKFCKKKKKSKKCCLRRLYIDFRKDLNWRWIHAPRGFYANYCSGKCPFLWGSENHHSTIMGLYNSLNKNAPGDPCCVAKSYEPLVILYFDDNRKPKIEELSQMSVTECVCL